MTRAIENDVNAKFAHLDKLVPVPNHGAIVAANRYERAWSSRGYGATYAAKAIHWYWGHRAQSTDIRPKAVDTALGEAVHRNAAAAYKFDVETEQPCSDCQYLSTGDQKRCDFCDRLLIWVIEPETSTCPEYKEPT